MAAKQFLLCHFCERCCQPTAAEGKADAWGAETSLSVHTQFSLSFLLQYLLCQEVGARAHPEAGKIISPRVAQKLSGSVGTLLPNSLLTSRLQTFMYFMEDLLVSKEPWNFLFKAHF